LLGIIGGSEPRALRAEIRELGDSLAAVETLQAWVEERLAAADEVSGLAGGRPW
jgi:hypothetical protein